jgi:hypothetical protein
MGLKDFASVFSRGFVVGYFVPAFVALFAVVLLAYESTLPDAFTEETGATQVLVLGALALVLGLALSALNRPVLRLLEGYPLARASGKRATRLNDALTDRFRKRFDALNEQLENPEVEDPTRAALELQEEFPAARDLILPTAFGNVMRSFETHPRRRYGLDGIAIWPRIELLLGEQELDTIGEAQANVNFFVNILVVSMLVGVVIAVDWAWHASGVLAGIAQVGGVLLATAAIAFGSYCGTIQAAKVWGDAVRAAFDVHRLDLYSKLGVRPPISPADELRVADAVNHCILFGEPIAMEFRSRPKKP